VGEDGLMPTPLDFTRYDTLDDIAYYNGDEGKLGAVIERARDAWSAYADANAGKGRADEKAFLAAYQTPIIPYMTDAVLLRAYQGMLGEPGDERADELLAEIERRQLDV
jgi:hypothetical protein